MTLMSQAEYARRIGISKAAITQWKNAGRLVLQGSLVDVEATDEYQKRYRREGMPAVKQTEERVKRGRPRVKQNNQLNSGETICLTRREILKRLEGLDFTQAFTWSDKDKRDRAVKAAQCLLWSAVEQPGMPGRYQLRLANGGELDGVPVRGFDFDLSAVEVLMECRDDLVPVDDEDWNEQVMIRPELLAALARPFHAADTR